VSDRRRRATNVRRFGNHADAFSAVLNKPKAAEPHHLPRMTKTVQAPPSHSIGLARLHPLPRGGFTLPRTPMDSTCRRKNHNGRRPAVDWAAAFSFYAALGPGNRSFRRVAAEFRVSEQSVHKWARREHWRERIADIDRRVAAKVNAEVDRSLADRRATTILIAEAVRIAFMRDLISGRYKPTASDVVAFAKLEMELGDVGAVPPLEGTYPGGPSTAHPSD
jgi:hypothetical protein